MARTVDPARYEARRRQIIDAALTVFAERGYDRATTAAICRNAGIGSGTFFHYFSTKVDVLLAILGLGAEETRQRAAEIDIRREPLDVLVGLVVTAAEEASDPRVPGFVRAVAGVMHIPVVAAALEADEAAQRDLYLPWVERGQRSGSIRVDLSPERIVSWLALWTGGFLERAAIDPDFDPQAEKHVLVDTVRHFLTATGL